MKTFKVSFTSRVDFHCQIEAFKRFHPDAVIDIDAFVAADAAALNLDNEELAPNGVGARVELELPFTEETYVG